MLEIVVVASACMLATVAAFRRAQRRAADRTVQEWILMFPGKCLPCSFARHYGDVPKPHPCPEGRSEPWPHPTGQRGIYR